VRSPISRTSARLPIWQKSSPGKRATRKRRCPMDAEATAAFEIDHAHHYLPIAFLEALLHN
jgi:hypothetical protein